jgi:predicted ATPase
MNNNEIKNLNELLDFNTTNKNHILDNLITSENNNTVNNIEITNNVYKDTDIENWGKNLPELCGSKKLILKILNNPINNKELLLKRQSAYINNYDDVCFKILKEYENDILWTFKLNDEILEDNAIHALFPSSFIYKYINLIEPILDSYHFYKIGFIPLSSLIYPITSLLAPFFYLKKYMNTNLTISNYLTLIKNFLILFFKSTGNFKQNILKFIFFCIYVFIYMYNIYQTFEFSYILYNTKKNLHKKMDGLIKFINEANEIIDNFNKEKSQEIMLKPFINKYYYPYELKLKNTMTDIYKLWKNDSIKETISKLLLTIYTYDIINSISKIKVVSNYNNCYYDNYNSTKIWGMKNPVLSTTQVSNPVDLNKNIIITGPNAAGKTTYVKSILSNIILSQTFGIIYGNKSSMQLYDCIYSFMRITDELGKKSYFEAEAELCLEMINKSNEMIKLNKKGLFLMDEPMHSTPPTEGMATAYAVAENIGLKPNINIIITTHFYKLTNLEKKYPDKFINLSVEAIENNNNFIFPYKIKKGSSCQCIAIELLADKKFPLSVINSAKNIKKIICNNILDKFNV